MSGLTGHIDHLYEDPNLTLSDIIKIYRSISRNSGDIDIYEKVDGYNIYLSYSLKDKKAKLLRNNNQIKTSGITLQELKEEFTTKRIQDGKKQVPANVVNAYVTNIEYFEKIIATAFNSEDQIRAIFGDISGNPEYFFNAEIIDPNAANIIKYDRKMIILHKLGNIKINAATSEISETDSEEVKERFRQLSDLFDKSNNGQISVTVDRPSEIASVNKNVLEKELGVLRTEFQKLNLDMDATVGKYFLKSIEQYLDREKLKLDSSQREFVVKSILAVGFGRKFLKKPRLNDFFRVTDTSQLSSLKELTNEDPAKEIFKTIKVPLEKILFNLSSILLDKYESRYISDNKQSADDIIHLVNRAIENIKSNGTPEYKNRLNTNLNRLRGSIVSFEELVNNPVEGLVFNYKDHVYKITSSFGPVNQIVGMSKFNMESINESKTIETNSMKVIFAGAFKPPHKGHLEVIKNFINLPKYNKKNFTVEKVIVIIGNKPRISKDNKQFDLKQSMDLFRLYIKAAGLESLVDLRITQRDNPVKDVYDYIANENNDSDKAQPGDVILLGTSKKDKGYYSNLAKFVKDKPWRVLFGEEYDSLVALKNNQHAEQDILGEVSASEFREAVSTKDLKEVDSFLPQEVLESQDYKKEAYKILGLGTPVQEIKESNIIEIINKKMQIEIKASPKLNLLDLVNRVNSIYNK